MTQEGVEYNLTRIETFLNYQGKLLREVKGMNPIAVLLEGYSRLMDYYGGGREQYSFLLFTAEDYAEIKEYSSLFEGFRFKEDFHSDNLPSGPPVMSKGYITFVCHTFTWFVKEIDKYPPTTKNILEKVKENISLWSKCDTIDEQIESCQKHCATEYDECCVRWKEHWSQYDEGLRVAITEVENKINEL